MELEKQIVSLELSKQLKLAGYEQEGFWWWNQNTFFSDEEKPLEYYLSRENKGFNSIVTPTVAEGLEKLPAEITVNNYVCILYINKNRNGYAVYYSSYNGKEGFSENDKTLSDAVHKMWLYLKKEDKL